jgi:hypothetical protein
VDDPHFWAGVLRPIFWVAVMIPLLLVLRLALNRYVRPRLTGGAWKRIQAPVGDVGAAVAILVVIVLAGLLVSCNA